MHKLISTSTAARPTGSPPQRRLFKVSSGLFKGRMALLYAESANNIQLKYADYPYQSWSSSQTIVSDSLDSQFSACMNRDGDIYLAYVDGANVLKCVKLTFSVGSWSAGAAATIINVDNSSNPFILLDSNDRLWCLFDHHRISYDMRHYIRAKYSTDDGQNWGSGPADLGTQLSGAATDPGYVTACQTFSRLFAVYCVNRSGLMYRTCDLSGPTWSGEAVIAELDYIDDEFDIAPSSDGRIGVVLTSTASQKLFLKEYDGLNWSGLIEIENAGVRSPQIAYQMNVPFIFYCMPLGNGYFYPRLAIKSGDSFNPFNYSNALGLFDRVFLFANSETTQIHDKTAAAANTSAGDIFHPGSQGMLDSVDDCLYLGKQAKFFATAFVLSVPGIGGAVVWEYFNGADWTQFTPYTGAYHFDSDDALVYLWQDGLSVPSDWQLTTVNGMSAYWIRARVTTGYSTNPVGTQILAALKCDDLVLVREAL